MQFYIGLVFESHSVHFQKIESFKKRYDSNYLSNPFIQLTLIPPFEIEFYREEHKKRFIENLSDLLEDHLIGVNEALQIEFNGIDIYQGKKGIISLTPAINSQFYYLNESIIEFLKDEGARIKSNNREENKIFMPIGRFEYDDQVELLIDQAKLNFSSPFVLNTSDFSLFERVHYMWNRTNTLFQFKKAHHLDFVNNLWAN